ncbi:MAG: hypothetical protein IKM79_02645 [Bacteroidales bacterium]|nr:hypothetical protein [Bacteroidales bacterium]
MKSIYTKLALISLLLVGVSGSATAREFVGGSRPHPQAASNSKAAVCKRAQSTAELNVNNVRAQINGYGNMWYDGSVAQYHIPKNGNTCPLYCAALWIGGTDVNDQLRIAALRFGQDGDDYWPGPLKIDRTATVDLEVCNRYDRHYVITKAEVLALKSHFEYPDSNVVNRLSDPGEDITDVIKNWPAKGEGENLSNYLAPFYDADGDGEYHPENGDYPYYDFDNDLCPRTLKANLPKGQNYVTTPTMEDLAGIVNGGILSDQVLKGDQTIWWVFNDMGNTHTETGGQPIGLEIRAQAFAFSTNDEINNMTFYSYEIINRSTYELRETYFSQWVDPDLGYARDDYVGCDVRRGLGYCYNGDEADGPGAGSYSGIPPAVGIDFFQGPYMDPDGKDNPKINISWIKTNGNSQLQQLLNKYKLSDGTYDTIAITDDADLFFAIDHNSWYFVPGDAIGNCAINGVNFGNNIIDDERFGMRRFVYYNNDGSANNGEPNKATDYYNYLRGYWRNSTRMKYGGDALTTGTTTLDCDFMYPGDSDPWHWGTDGEVPSVNPDDWTEANMGNAVDDRRFMQSAGPFTLRPGALNYITVGIPFAQASSGNAWSSVELLRQIDDVCQSLFENCFKVLDGPDAPTMTAQELNNEIILYLHYDNPESNNNKGGVPESYSEIDPAIVRSFYDANGKLIEYSEDQRSYKFEGYQIYQLVDANASVADIGDISKARLVAQCDIENYYDEIDSVVVSYQVTNGDTMLVYDTIFNSNPSRPIGTLVNFTTNSATGLLSGEVMVSGSNRGVQHVFRVTNDMFATGINTKLVNNKEYYYIAIAYAFNCFKEYSQTDAAFLDGQKEPYLAGRKNERGQSITPITVIPHNTSAEDGGKLAQSEFGMCPNIIRIEGYGNGGSQLRLTNESITELMGAPGAPAKAPGTFVDRYQSATGLYVRSEMNDPCIIRNPSYEENYGPLNVRVIDPLKVKEGDFNILFWNNKIQNRRNVNDSTAGITNTTRWCIVKANGEKIPVSTATGDVEYVDTVWSDFSISRYNEQLFLELGLAVTLVNPEDAASDPNPTHYEAATAPRFWGGFVNKGALLGSEMLYSNENTPWLSGIPDNDNSMTTNWIRSGSQYAPEAYNTFYGGSGQYRLSENHLDEDYFKTIVTNAMSNPSTEAMDKNQEFESVVGGLWSPYALVSTLPFHPGFNFSYYMPEDRILDSLHLNKYSIQRHLMTNFYNKSINYSDMSQLPSVRIVFTSDTSKWTRCPVIEMCDDYTQSEGNARKFSVRNHKSVDKLGRTCDDINTAPDTDDPNNPAYISETGMGWFPGYAINVTTGERLNIMFGEDSRFVQYNGRDMLWNPVNTLMDGTQNYVLGGRHFVYVMNATNQVFDKIVDSTGTELAYFRTPSYDAGRWSRKMLSSVERLMKRRYFKSGSWQLFNGVIYDEIQARKIPVRDSIAMLYASVAWVNMPLISPRYSFNYPGRDETLNENSASNGIPCDVTVNIDIRNPYGQFMSPNFTTVQQTGSSSINKNLPAYQFRISSSDAVLEGLATSASARQSYIDSILGQINVVPNPYYSYSKYETASQLETKVRIVNLPTGVNSNGEPEGCLIRIYTVDGTLVRTLGPTAVSRDISAYGKAENTTVDWDLHNHTGIPIAGGVYLIHVSVPGIGERVIKWFGTMRPVDLNSFQF